VCKRLSIFGVRRLVAVIAAATALCGVSSASGAPSVLVSVGHTDRHPTASWALSHGTESREVEIATAPTQASDGYFFTENTVVRSRVQPAQTEWVYRTQLDPGTYYVHVASFDPNCAGCPRREWSNMLTLTIPADSGGDTAAGDGAAPRIRDARFTLLSRGDRPRWRLQLTVCDDGASTTRLRIHQNTRMTTHKQLGVVDGCRELAFTFSAPASFRGPRLTVEATALNARAFSNTVRETWRIA
jgi:hypothetical protein